MAKITSKTNINIPISIFCALLFPALIWGFKAITENQKINAILLIELKNVTEKVDNHDACDKMKTAADVNYAITKAKQ